MTAIDQMGRKVVFPFPPKRIISLVPSQTELMFDLELEEELIGITKFCVHPKGKVKSKVDIGGTKRFKFDIIDQLKPDIIIGNKEENYKEGIDYLAAKYPIWMSDISNLEDAFEMISKVGEITNRKLKADWLVENISKKFRQTEINKLGSVAYLIWQDPLMIAANQTFINEMLAIAGFRNAFANQNRYPQVTEEDLIEASPDFIFLSSEPYPFKEKHLFYYENVCPFSKVVLVDGEAFSWYGSRLLTAPNYFDSLHLQLFK